MIYRVEIWPKDDVPDVRGLGLVKDIQDLGIKHVSSVRVIEVYWIDAELRPGELNMLVNPVICFRKKTMKITIPLRLPIMLVFLTR